MFGCCISETTIGIVIGSVFTLLGVIVNGLITFALNRSVHNREVEEHKRREKKELEDEKRAKREKALKKARKKKRRSLHSSRIRMHILQKMWRIPF